ncbi:hypothetical protein INT46_005720 [Mucor plumbeus]|uniref:Uncharacterized protein n=1 Tax=Mucor plumbeus TaxID=97098 RepID=A0A8H7QDX9_9FUNG|nr:hypothetical protein INT46_005720 [Mucor plumbeus]
MAHNKKSEASQKADEIENTLREGASDVAKTVDKKLNNTNENVDSAAKRAEEEINKLKAELTNLRRRAGPKIQKAENFLCSPAAINFYKGLAFKKYACSSSRY